MAKIIGAVVVNENRCKGCDLCVVACPCDVLGMTTKDVNHKGYKYCEVVNENACIGCAACAIVCPDGCIDVYKKKID